MSFFLHNQTDRENIAKQYLSIKDYKEGMKLLQDVTSEPYHMIVIDNHKAGSREYKDYIHKYKAKIKTPRFKIRSEQKGKSIYVDTQKIISSKETLRIPLS